MSKIAVPTVAVTAAPAAARAPATFDPTHIVTVNVTNPKRPGTKCHDGFAVYKSGLTVAETAEAYVRAGWPRKYAYSALRWDTARNYVTVAPKAE